MHLSDIQVTREQRSYIRVKHSPKSEGGIMLLRKLWVGYGRNREQRRELMYSDLKCQASKVLGARRGGRGRDRILKTRGKKFLSSSHCKIFASKEESQGMERKPE